MQPLLQGSGSVAVGKVHFCQCMQQSGGFLWKMAPPEIQQIFKITEEIKCLTIMVNLSKMIYRQEKWMFWNAAGSECRAILARASTTHPVHFCAVELCWGTWMVVFHRCSAKEHEFFLVNVKFKSSVSSGCARERAAVSFWSFSRNWKCSNMYKQEKNGGLEQLQSWRNMCQEWWGKKGNFGL